jgi:NAD(P)-dependent dehydrogenase (short-subunit alcohol dehydrogenase family)
MNGSMNKGAALVTGGAQRLGRAMGLALAARGFDVAVHYVGSKDEAAKTAAEIEAFGVNATLLQADLTDESQSTELVGQAAEALDQPLTVLINNASIFEYDTIKTASRESWDRHIESNLRAPFVLTQEFAEQAPSAGVDGQGEPIAMGCVINMIDQRVRKLTPEFMSYTIAKMGLWAFTQTAARALAPGIRVNAIGPGPTLQGARQSEQHFANQRAGTVLKRGSNPDDIVAAMNYILDAPALTGQLLCIDGGQHLGWQTPDIQGIE